MNIVLCGFMGSGKTVVGKELAKIMGRRFVDTDQLVEARSGVSIPAIFQVHGEDYFRELERAACAEAAEIPNCVISTGGGALTFDENVRTLRTTGKIVLLDASFEVICQRVGNGANRPLFRDRCRPRRCMTLARPSIVQRQIMWWTATPLPAKQR